ncbi:hypothetical protein LCGC14_0660460 [marine sediment metagenome]|uniref:Uncharacterized protein n=1 Tax=marine sediment metagenome TaxID=412755 RepID=A0A0F9U238_9ZZZZ
MYLKERGSNFINRFGCLLLGHGRKTTMTMNYENKHGRWMGDTVYKTICPKCQKAWSKD